MPPATVSSWPAVSTHFSECSLIPTLNEWTNNPHLFHWIVDSLVNCWLADNNPTNRLFINMKRTFSRPDLSLASVNYATVWCPVIGPVPTTDDQHYKGISSHKGPNVHTIKTHLYAELFYWYFMTISISKNLFLYQNCMSKTIFFSLCVDEYLFLFNVTNLWIHVFIR